MHHDIAFAAHLPSVLLLVFIGTMMFVEADATLVFVGVLIHLHLVTAAPAIFVSVLAGCGNDYLFYRLGTHLKTKDHAFIRWIGQVTRRINVHISAHPFKAIFITKFMYGIVGIHRATLLRTGMNGLPLRKFILYNGISILVWATALILLGYSASHSIAHVSHVMKIIELSGISLIALFFVGNHVYKKNKI